MQTWLTSFLFVLNLECPRLTRLASDYAPPPKIHINMTCQWATSLRRKDQFELIPELASKSILYYSPSPSHTSIELKVRLNNARNLISVTLQSHSQANCNEKQRVQGAGGEQPNCRVESRVRFWLLLINKSNYRWPKHWTGIKSACTDPGPTHGCVNQYWLRL